MARLPCLSASLCHAGRCTASVAALLALAACSGFSRTDTPPPERLVFPPLIRSTGPALAIPGSVTRFGLEGAYFGSAAPGDVPVVTLTRVRGVDGEPLSGPAFSTTTTAEDVPYSQVRPPVQRVFVDVDARVLPAGVYDASVQTPIGIARFADALVLPPDPSVTALESDGVCGTSPFAIVGENLYRIPWPNDVVVEMQPGDWYWEDSPIAYRDRALTVSGCRPVPFRIPGLELCTRIEALPPPDDTLLHGRVTVLLPGLAPGTFDLTRDLWMDRGRYPDPGARAAVDAALDLPLWTGLVAVGDRFQPIATIDGTPFDVRATGCSPSDVPSVLACTGLAATIPQGFPPGDHVLRVDTGAGCSGGSTLTLGGRPVITSVTPASTCERSGERVRVCADGLLRSTFEIGPLRFTGPGAGSGCVEEAPSSYSLSPGIYPIVVVNGTVPPVSSVSSSVTITPGPPDVYWPRPRVVYSGATRTVHVPMARITGSLTSAALIATNGSTVGVQVAAAPAGADLTYPALGTAELYTIRIADESPCPGFSTEYLHTTATPSLVHEGFDTPWASTDKLYTWSEVAGAAPALQWLDGQGVPGGAMAGERAADGPDWYFAIRMDSYWKGAMDLGGVAFDLRLSASAGAPSAAPRVVVRYYGYGVERSLPVPIAGEWTHYEFTFDDPEGWTRRSEDGSARPATHDDLLGNWPLYDVNGDILVLGSWWSGQGQAAIDNVSVELAR